MHVSDNKKKELDKTVFCEIEKKNIVGLSLYLTNEEKSFYYFNYGKTSSEKENDIVSQDTLFKVASNTKMTTSLVGLILREQGEIDFDKSVKYYLPWFNLNDEIKIENLLSHTAGLPSEYTPDGERDEDRLEEVLKKDVPKLTLEYKPRCGYKYSNWGFRLLSLIYQKITNMQFSKLDSDLVLKPLGMNSSTFDIQKAMTYSFALPHDKEGKVIHKIEINATRYAAGGLISSAKDMSCLSRCLLNYGYPLINRESFEYMCKRIAKTQSGFYGLGLQESNYNEKSVLGHGGDNNPYFSTTKVIQKDNIGIGIMCNTDGVKQFVTVDLPNIIFDILFK